MRNNDEIIQILSFLASVGSKGLKNKSILLCCCKIKLLYNNQGFSSKSQHTGTSTSRVHWSVRCSWTGALRVARKWSWTQDRDDKESTPSQPHSWYCWCRTGLECHGGIVGNKIRRRGRLRRQEHTRWLDRSRNRVFIIVLIEDQRVVERVRPLVQSKSDDVKETTENASEVRLY